MNYERRLIGAISLLIGCGILTGVLIKFIQLPSTGSQPTTSSLIENIASLLFAVWFILTIVSKVSMIVNQTRIKWNLMSFLLFLVIFSGTAVVGSLSVREHTALELYWARYVTWTLIAWAVIDIADYLSLDTGFFKFPEVKDEGNWG